MAFADQHWELNPSFSAGLLASGLWWNIKSVLFEELIFRGALLYILLKELGTVRAILVSSAAFGAYHWFSQELLGNIPMMAQTFLLGGAMGVVLSLAFARTGSLFVPCAIHAGWNITQSVLFSDGNIGPQVLVPVLPFPEVTVSYAAYVLIVGFPMVSMLLFNYLLLHALPETGPASG
jgi:membrane protease YdiL (CAAX protease family)